MRKKTFAKETPLQKLLLPLIRVMIVCAQESLNPALSHGRIGYKVPVIIITNSAKAGNWRSGTLVNSIQSVLLRYSVSAVEEEDTRI